ncbi:membrane-bound O-acyltransferase domain-containing protein 2-like [Tropilaelaps mercedesae]|uniref:Membrane-bound O-acyltransferase domain-containing protein 2-like n=1 Tax=Tropilaelaps mercedesae TaxID=418985 RepID=A0A1V9XYQ5_9ACAR|nr:membrane-bound O-acyltransferase domain-containing protein 2-like [Tropilaelaps mercedesae]
MSHWRSQLSNYHGSTVLQPVAQLVGVQVDKFNFLIAGLSSIGMGYLYSYLVPVGSVSVRTRKALLITIGLSLLYFCFGRDVLHVVAEAAIAFVLMQVVPIDQLPLVTLVVTLLYQSGCHLIRQFTDPDGYTIDITGAIMMLTQRVSTLAFSLRDGVRTEGLTEDQKRDAVPEKPDALSYFAYMFDFHEILAGPLISYNEFLRIAEGRNVRPGQREPTPHWEVARKLAYVFVNAALVLKVVPLLTERELLSDWFSALPFYKKVLCLNAFSFLSRVQYYLVWKLSEAVCNSSGYGYYVTSDGERRWDGADNIHIFHLETAPSLKVVLDNWNVSTQRWLKHVCYDRQVPSKTGMTFLLSAVWHGFYPGYFLAFMTCSLFVTASRKVRRCLRPRLVRGQSSQFLYDVVTFCFSSSFLAYTTAPFVLLQFGKAVRIWREVFFFGHALALAAFALPILLPPGRPKGDRPDRIGKSTPPLAGGDAVTDQHRLADSKITNGKVH